MDWRCHGYASSPLPVPDGPLGDAREMRIVVVVVGEARAAQRTVGRRRIVEARDVARQAFERAMRELGDIVGLDVVLVAGRLAAGSADVAQRRNGQPGHVVEARLVSAGKRDGGLERQLRRDEGR